MQKKTNFSSQKLKNSKLDSPSMAYPDIKSENNSTTQLLNPSTFDSFAVKVEGVSKKYCKSLKRSMLYGVKDIARNTIGLSSHSDKLRKNEFWALDDISFEVKKGETLGIIGPNGSGKTTLLKLLNGIFWPDKGKITIKGKVGALIEVGAGFHPLLTGRENIYINAAILGMTKEETDKKFNEIVEFADIGDFLDVPVKHYSSGMFVRLGFAVAVHCEPDILLVDEVLAVGDINFQNKCFNKIGELMSRGTTTILVSHNIISIQRICDRCAWLNLGKVIMIDDSMKVCDMYQFKTMKEQEKISSPINEDEGLHIENIFFYCQGGDKRNIFNPNEPILVKILVNPKENIVNPILEIRLKSLTGIEILHVIEQVDASFPMNLQKTIEFQIEHLPLTNDIIYTNVILWNQDMTKLFARRSGNYSFRIASKKNLRGQLSVNYEIRVGKYV